MMDTQLNRQCLEVLHAKTVKEFVRLSAEFGQSMGFHTMAAMVISDHAPDFTEVQSVTDAPPEYMPTFEDLNSAKADPVLQHCKQSSSPIVWDQRTYVLRGVATFGSTKQRSDTKVALESQSTFHEAGTSLLALIRTSDVASHKRRC